MRDSGDADASARRPWLSEYGAGIDGELHWLPDANLAALCTRAAEEHGEGTAFSVCLENGLSASMSFREVEADAERFAAYLRHELGIAPGDRVAVQAPNCLPYPVCVIGIFKAAGVLVNVNPLYTERETRDQLADSGARVLVVIDMFGDKLRDALDGTAIEHVVRVSVADGFTGAKSLLIRGMLRYVKRLVPEPTHATTAYADALAAGEPHLPRLREEGGPSTGHDDLAVLQYTGGTTGVAKGAELTHGNLIANVSQVYCVAGPALHPGEDTVLTALPLYHIFAFTFNFMTFYTSGCHNVLCPSPRPPARLRRAFERFRITKFSAVNALFQGLLREPWFRESPPRSIDLTVAGGTALHHSTAEEWQEVVGTAIWEGYGLSETSPVVAVNPPCGEARLGTIGVPVPATDVRILGEDGADLGIGEVGELLVRGPQVMRGYWQRPEETAAATLDGWFRTGDMARMDERGYLSIVDRKKDMIDVSGFNVFPNEVEDVLDGHPDILEVAVVGARGDNGNEIVRAFVVPGSPELTAEAITEWARQYLAAYKVPTEIIFRDELPKSPVGKILRKELREPAGG